MFAGNIPIRIKIYLHGHIIHISRRPRGQDRSNPFELTIYVKIFAGCAHGAILTAPALVPKRFAARFSNTPHMLQGTLALYRREPLGFRELIAHPEAASL
jgi:hypothetical protein